MLNHLTIGLNLNVEKHLNIKSGCLVADITTGNGGHLERFAHSVGPTGLVIALDQDARCLQSYSAAGVALKHSNIFLYNTCFLNIFSILHFLNVKELDAVFADLGFSSPQIDNPARGFSFLQDGPLDMRMNKDKGLTAFELINKSNVSELAQLLYKYGNEPFAYKIARKIKSEKYFPNSTHALASLICKIYTKPCNHHPATKSFQALRIAVNQETEKLTSLFKKIPKIIKTKGLLGILSFHSIEDQLIKKHFHQNKILWRLKLKLKINTHTKDIEKNPRARCATLRIFQKLI
ncbi:MAG: 16S rRNA (cytosine(1402)-N(4))-methyltransferase RsmH [Deltaproteobacteria bacterium]|nr:MAG: 16S rRNA (cytosine(1402)-N(4))-methyltransferase RsmH [Deltaproteobacteria bacterium]